MGNLRKKVQYKTQTEKEMALIENQSLLLVEEQNITDGNFLIFSDTAPTHKTIYTNIPQEEIETLKNNQTLMQKAIDDLLLGGL